jgi:hypothetical protein
VEQTPIKHRLLLLGLLIMVSWLFLSAATAFGQSSNPQISDAAVQKLLGGIEDGESLDGGRYAKIGSAAVYVASTKQIPTYDRLNWVIVRVLSEKYGCFIRRKANIANETRYACRDGRTIVFHRYHNRNWMVFHARQFDQVGREMIVENHRIVGFGERQLYQVSH